MRSKIKFLLVALSLSGGPASCQFDNPVPPPPAPSSRQFGNPVPPPPAPSSREFGTIPPPPAPSSREFGTIPPPPAPSSRQFGNSVPAPSGAHAQALDPQTISKIAATTRSLCLSGSQYDIQANADGSLSLLKLEPGGQGKLRITQSTGTGGALNYQDEGKRVEADKHIIGCINQNLPVLLTAAGARLAPPGR